MLNRHSEMQLQVNSSDFLARCESLVKSNNASLLIYAALELRLGIEARLAEYIQYAEGLSSRGRQDWEITKLARSIDYAYGLGDMIMIFLVKTNSDESCHFMYTPVSRRLQDIGKKCGEYLHARRLRAIGSTKDLSELRLLLDEGVPLLKLACAGEIVRPKGKHGFYIRLNDGDPRAAVVSAIHRGDHRGAALLTITPTGPVYYVAD